MDLPDPEADPRSVPAQVNEQGYEDLTEQLHNSENEEEDLEATDQRVVPKRRQVPLLDRDLLGPRPQSSNLRPSLSTPVFCLLRIIIQTCSCTDRPHGNTAEEE